MNGLSNRTRDAVANTGCHRGLLAAISIAAVATTVFYYDALAAGIAATASSDSARARSMRLFVSSGFAFSTAEPTIVTRD
jgi:hypothetical protein